MEALHATGFATLPTSRRPDDGLELIDVRITAAVRCAPPDNKPTAEEIATCNPYLGEVIRLMPNLRVIVSLGGVALKALHTATQARESWAFAHGAEHTLPDGRPLLVSYHPSQQNTRTGRLRWDAWMLIWQRARAILDAA
jgi:uracil-DNA glycosylase family 4